MPDIAVSILEGPLPEPSSPFTLPGAGAILRFDGVVRPLENGRAIVALYYEVYQPMADKQLHRLARETIDQHPGVLGMHILHSRGHVPIHQCSFRLIVASRHRAEGLAATGVFIDRMKQDVPIWKAPLYQTEAPAQ